MGRTEVRETDVGDIVETASSYRSVFGVVCPERQGQEALSTQCSGLC